MNELDREFLAAIADFDRMFLVVAGSVPAPVMVQRGGGIVFKYIEQSADQAIVQKLARYVSGLRAARLLLRSGFTQESVVIQRTLDEFGEDITFLSLAIVSGYSGDTLRLYLEEFYADDAEHSDNPKDWIKQKQRRVSRKEIRQAIDAANEVIAKKANMKIESATEPVRIITKLFSGFVHGGSPQIMELYGGMPAHFHLNGMLGAPLMAGHIESFWNRFYRCGQSFAFAAQALGLTQVGELSERRMKALEKAAGKNYPRSRQVSS